MSTEKHASLAKNFLLNVTLLQLMMFCFFVFCVFAHGVLASEIALPASDAYGKIKNGDQTHTDKIVYSFGPSSKSMLLHCEIYDVDYAGEVVITLNGNFLVNAPKTANYSWSSSITVFLPFACLNSDQENILVIDNKRNPPSADWWGARNVWIGDLVAVPLPSSAGYGYIRDGDQSHKDEVVYSFGPMSSSVVLHYVVYDIGTATEVEIFLNDHSLGYVPKTAYKKWSGDIELTLPREYLSADDTNILIFSNAGNRNALIINYWGVREVSIEGEPGDATPPAGTVTINNNEPSTSSMEVMLALSAQDEAGGSGIAQMKFSHDAIQWSNAVPYATSQNWTLQAGSGMKTVYVQFSDNANNWSEVFSDAIILDASAPTVPVIVDDGQTTNNATQLHAAWSASDPESGIVEYQYAIGFGPATAEIVNWTTAGMNTEITHANLNLSTDVAYYFSVKAKNGAGLWSPIGSSDGIAVINHIPSIISLSPPANAVFTQGEVVSVAVEAEDFDGDPLSYRFLVDGIVLGDWSVSHVFAWQTQAGDIHTKTITVEVCDPFGGLSSAVFNVFLFRKVPAP